MEDYLIRAALEESREKLSLTFEEEDHVYSLMGKTDYPSVSSIVDLFCKKFEGELIALRKSKGDQEAADALLEEWAEGGRKAAQRGNRVHYELEKASLELFGLKKEVRLPAFDLTKKEIEQTDKMVFSGISWLHLMKERGCILVDTEVVMGSEELGYVGQCDTLWLVPQKNNPKGYDLCMSDYKTSKVGKFDKGPFDKKMSAPFDFITDMAKNKYDVQICLYEKLLLDMLKSSIFKHDIVRGSIIVHVLEHLSYKEYYVSPEVRKVVKGLDIKERLTERAVHKSSNTRGSDPR